MFKFKPDEKIRDFSVEGLVGKELELELQHTDADNTIGAATRKHKDMVKQHEKDLSLPHPGKFVPPTPKPNKQYCCVSTSHQGLEHMHLSGWIPYAGENGTVVKVKVTEACLMEHSNGGRRDLNRYVSYLDYYNPNKRKECEAHWLGGVMGRILGGRAGDPDRVDIVVKLKILEGRLKGQIITLDDSLYELEPPEEWMSELYADESCFRCADGFYPDADTAISVFGNKASDDMFGERYFPVISIDVDHENADKLQEAAWIAKGCSSPVVANGKVFIGLRCKPYEYAQCISECYEMGGSVPVGMQWDWNE